MADSSRFLQKHPDQMTLWEFRVAAALILNAPDAGYEAGQKLLSAGAADSSDPKLQQLLAQLKNRGWLDKEDVEVKVHQQKFRWLFGTWDTSFNWVVMNHDGKKGKEEFVLSNSGKIIDGYGINDNGVKCSSPDLRCTLLDSGEEKWECYLPKFQSRRFFHISQKRHS